MTVKCIALHVHSRQVKSDANRVATSSDSADSTQSHCGSGELAESESLRVLVNLIFPAEDARQGLGHIE